MDNFGPQPDSRPFTFDTVFDGDAVIRPPRPKRAFTPEEVEAIRAEAFAAGERSAVARAEAEAARSLTIVTAASREAMQALTRLAHDHRSAAAELALCAARKIADAALEAFPEAPVAAALAALARDLEATPRLVVHTGGDTVRMEAALTKAAENAGFPGQIVLKSDPGLPLAAFIFDWGDGRATFDPQAASARVEEALRGALTAEGLHAEPLFPSTATEA
jgi:flagellar assembly protein FliH